MTGPPPGGAVGGRSAPRRVFHALDDRHGAVVGSHMPATEALRIFNLPAIPVAEAGQLIGIVRAVNLVDADASITVADLMDPPVSIDVGAPVSAAQDLAHHLGGGPVPVTGSDGRLLGVMDVADGHATDLTEL